LGGYYSSLSVFPFSVNASDVTKRHWVSSKRAVKL
jgi:hypothetical protein